MSYHLHTLRGYSFPAVSSAMQKAIRRGDAKLAGYWGLELWASGFGQYVWRRLLTVSAEDCWGILTAEVKALHDSYTEINKTTTAKKPKGRIFISNSLFRSEERIATEKRYLKRKWKAHIRLETYKSQDRVAMDAPRRQSVKL